MSLDVYLKLPGAQSTTGERIFIREDGRNKELTRAEWDARYPDREPATMTTEEVYSANITHNLGKMASEAGVYQSLWRPEELRFTRAEQLIEPLTRGLAHLRGDPEHFKQFNPENGWGNYEGLVEFVQEYLIACIRYPNAEISVSR